MDLLVHCRTYLGVVTSILLENIMTKTEPKWWEPIGTQSTPRLRNKAFWLRSAAHYRDPFWSDTKQMMYALRMVKAANKAIKMYDVNCV